MAKVPWNRAILEEFSRLAFLTQEEEAILKSRIAGWNQVKQCHEFHMSPATLNRRIRAMKDKYASAREYSDILPGELDF